MLDTKKKKKKEPVKFNFNNTLPGYSRRVCSGHLGKFDTGELGRMGFFNYNGTYRGLTF